ncbi:MAG: leucine-rich repeat protein [Clostridia bacterium]|nr:leucine-rich repeat protein [Clostridia bacterium]
MNPRENQTNIIKDTTFLFILTSARVSITVYDDPDLSRIRSNATSYLVNNNYTFPTGTPAPVSGMNFSGWRLYDGNKYSTKIYKAGETWKIDNTSFGSDIKVVPYYTTAYAIVTFSFIFTDIVDSATSRSYKYDKVIDRVYQTQISTIDYAAIVSYLQSIKNTNNGSEVNNGSEAGGKAALAVKDCEIASVTYNNRPFTVDSSVTVASSELSFLINLTSADVGTKFLTYVKTLALYEEPTVVLPAGDYVTEWKYGDAVIDSFPCVLPETTFSYGLLKYKTAMRDAYVTAPGFYALDVNVGATVPENAWFVMNGSEYVYTDDATVQNGTTYYGYYVPAGYALASVTEGEAVAADTYYVYGASFSLTADTTFAAGTKYFVRNYVENTTDFDSDYFFGYEVDSVDVSSPYYEEGVNIYIPSVKTIKEGGVDVTRPVVSIGNSVFLKGTVVSALSGDDTTYLIAGLSDNLLKIGDEAFVACYMYGLTDFASVSYVGEDAFKGATFVGDISFPALKTAGVSAFSQINAFNRKGVASFTFDSLEVVSEKMFCAAYGTLTVTLGDACTTLEPNAFYSAENLVAVNGLDNIVSVGEYAFAETALTSINLPNVETIGEFAFSAMLNLTELVLGGNGAITDNELDLRIVSGCENLTVIAIGRQDENVQQAANVWDTQLKRIVGDLSGNYKVETIKLPASLEFLGATVFDSFPMLKEVIIPSSAANYFTDDGVLYSVANDTEYTLVYYPVDKTGDYAVDLPEGATKLTLAPAAFGVAEISLLDLTGVPSTAAIVVPNGSFNAALSGIKTVSTDDSTVRALYGLAIVYIDGVTSEQLSGLVTNNAWDADRVKLGSDYAYYYDAENKLLFAYDTENRTAALVGAYRYAEAVTVPATVTIGTATYTVNEIKAGAFYGFENLTSLTVNAILGVFPEGIFGDNNASCDKLEQMTFAGWVAGSTEGANAITMASFKYTAWYDQSTIIYAGGVAFGYNSDAADQALTADELTSVGFTTSIPTGFFSGAHITSVVFPRSLSTIENNAFYGCAELRSVDFGTVSGIGETAFYGCVLLTDANIPYLTNLGTSAFEGCSSLVSFKAPLLERMPIKAFKDCGQLKTTDLSGLKSFIADSDGNSNAFENCSSIEEINMPAFTADTLPGYVFVGTSIKVFDFTKYNSVKTIGEQAFAQCGVLSYVQLSAYVTEVESDAFVGCPMLNVEISYSSGGLYIAKTFRNGYYEGTLGDKRAKVAADAFDSGARFYVQGDVDVNTTFLQDYSDVQTSFPSVRFEFFTGNGIDFSFRNDNIGMSDLGDRIYIESGDITPPDLSANGLTFVGWSTEKTSYTELTLPTVITGSTTFYAKYISTLRGTLTSTDVEYVYLIAEKPEVTVRTAENFSDRKDAETALYNYILKEVDPSIEKSHYYTGEFINFSTVVVTRAKFEEIMTAAGFSDPELFMRVCGISDEWTEILSYSYVIKRADGTQTAEATISSFPFILNNVKSGDSVRLYATVTSYQYMYTGVGSNCIALKEIATKRELGSVGDFGYAIVNYESTDSGVVLPELYSDGVNGEAGIIALYAGAFRKAELRLAKIELPETIKVIVKGYIVNNAFTSGSTFNDNFVEIVLPEGIVYVEDGTFAGLKNLAKIGFGDDSALTFVSKNSFLGTTWYKNAVWEAESGKNNGFVMAGKTAVEYVGKTSSLFVTDSSVLHYTDSDAVLAYQPGLSFGWSLERNGTVVSSQTMKVVFVNSDGTNSAAVDYAGSGAIVSEQDGTYTIEMTAAGRPDITLALYSRAVGDRKAGDVKSVSFSALSAQIASVRFVTKSGESVTLPASAVKLADGILKDNTDMIKVTVNVDLKYIGKEAFSGSALTTVMYNGSQEASKIVSVGENAFSDTPWYTATENVIIGTVYLKYNNTGTGSRYSGNSKKFAVEVPAYVTRIAAGAFENATGLGGVTFRGTKLTVIEKNAFAGSGIERIVLPSSVVTLERGVFGNCVALVDADLSSTKLSELPQDAFFGCVNLVNLSLPATVKTFGKNAFAKDRKLSGLTATGVASVDVNAGVEWDGVNASGNLDGSALKDTAWYSPEQGNEDRFITLGNVLVKYVIGRENVTSGESVSVEIPAGTQTILKKAFYGNVYITEVTIPASVKTIGESAFEGCTALKTVTFTGVSNLDVIETAAFKDCSSLQNIVLPSKLTRIEGQAFEATKITTVVLDNDGKETDGGFTIPDTVTYIGEDAFYGVTTLTYLTLGASLTYIGKGAFNTNYTSLSGSTELGILYKVIWNASADTFDTLSSNISLVATDTGRPTDVFSSASSIVIRFYFPEGVMNYVSGSDLWNTNDSSNVGFICKEQNGAESLPKVSLDLGGSSTDIYTELIKQGDLEAPVKENQTFVEWVIGESAERGTPITYPFEVRQNAIVLYARFVENNPDAATGYTVSGGNIVAVDPSVTTLYVPATVGGVTIKGIGLNEPNDTVKKIVFTKASNFNGLTTNIFANYTALESVEIPNDASSADFIVVSANAGNAQVVYDSSKSKLIAFIGNADGLEFEIPNKVNEICEGAFINSGLASITIPSTVSKIGQDAFHAGLKTLKIEKGIALDDVTYAAFSARGNDSFWNRDVQSSIQEDAGTKKTYNVVKGLRSKYQDTSSAGSVLGYFHSLGNVLLGYVNLDATVLNMADKLADIDITVLASNIFNIDGRAKVAFDSVTLPSSVKKINVSAFSNCNITGGITSKKYDKLTDIADDVFKNMTFYENANHSLLILGKVLVKATFTSTSADEAIDLTGYSIETIMKDAFNNSRATRVFLPSSLLRIGVNAFYSATNLSSISIPNSVTYIGKGAFANCTKLSIVEFQSNSSSLAYLGDNAFLNCTSLGSIELPASLREIGDMAFYNCTKLTTVTFDGYIDVQNSTGGIDKKLDKKSQLVSLGVSAFSGCSMLTKITIPDGLTEIKQTTFRNCTSLLTVDFGQNSRLKVIGQQAFYGCSKLGSMLTVTMKEKASASESDEYETDLITLDLPNSLTKVENNAFQGCTGLWGVQFNYNIDELGESIFSGCKNLVKINFYRSTPPTVKNNTFEIGDDANYRLRIYVVPSESTGSDSTVTYGATMENYIEKWENVYINNENVMYYLYERGTAPTLTLNEQTYHVEYYIGILAGTAVAENWTYTDVKQKSEWYYGQSSNYVADSDTDRKDKKAVDYGQQRYNDGEYTYVILIVDYDEMTVVSR